MEPGPSPQSRFPAPGLTAGVRQKRWRTSTSLCSPPGGDQTLRMSCRQSPALEKRNGRPSISTSDGGLPLVPTDTTLKLVASPDKTAAVGSAAVCALDTDAAGTVARAMPASGQPRDHGLSVTMPWRLDGSRGAGEPALKSA